MQLVFRLGTLGSENFGVLWNQDYCPLVQEEEEKKKKTTRGLLFSHAFVEAHAGYTAAAAKSLQADHLLQDLSVCHILGGGGGYLISEDLAFVLEW
jgi:hypothetical protein